MNRTLLKTFLFIFFCQPIYLLGFAQEYAGALRWNQFQAPRGNNSILKSAKKTTTTLTLPFFEDFTGYSASPDSFKWQDAEVYINNTMGVMPVSRGVATFDDLNARGIPYDSFSNVGFETALPKGQSVAKLSASCSLLKILLLVTPGCVP